MKTFNQVLVCAASLAGWVFYGSVLFAQLDIQTDFSLNAESDTQNSEHTDHHVLEEVFVSGVLSKAAKDTALPVSILSDDELRENAASTIGETLQGQLGVHVASFGTGVGQPIIRGQGGNRVQVLQNGTGALDVSATSQDHANSVEALLAKSIEVVRGPATLLYGNGAIGGVVNVIDNRIPDTVPEQVEGVAEYRFNNANQGSTLVGVLEGGAGQFAWHFDCVMQETQLQRIPGAALLSDEGLSVTEGSIGYVENSNTDKTNMALGGSWIGDKSYAGVSLTQLDNEYGLPPGAHAHVVGEEEVFVQLDMQQTRVDVKAGVERDGWFESLKAQLTLNDYTHSELEGIETGTVFDNQGIELRVNAQHRELDNGLLGAWGVQYTDRNFSALGVEAFIPASAIRSYGVYAVESMDVQSMTYEAGARFDRQIIDTNAGCSSTESSRSLSAAAIWNFREDANVLVSINRSQRAPSVEELYSNFEALGCGVVTDLTLLDPSTFITHVATSRIELGNASLDSETANNIEIGLRKHAGDIQAELSAFINSVDNYIYLLDIGEHNGTIISRYLQEDARFIGVEASVDIPLRDTQDGNALDLNLFADYVEAELSSGTYLPRIPPLRYGTQLSFAQEDWLFKFRNTVVQIQDKTSLNETATEAYHRLDVYLDYHLHKGEREWLISLKGNNLGNQTIRNHSSFLKLVAPQAGRSVEFAVRYAF